MNKPMELSVDKSIDSVQQRLASYASNLNFHDLPPEVIHAAKVRVIDTLAALIGGFFGEPCRIARDVAASMPCPSGATIIGTRMKTTPDVAALVNGTTSRYAEMNDHYHWPGSSRGHPSDTLTAVLGAAEHAQASGRDFITGVVLAYEIYLRICDVFHNLDSFDNTNFACLGIATATGKVWGLTTGQLSHCISMAVVPNVVLRQVRAGQKSMFKAVAAGQAGRAGVFAAQLARAGMEGPHLPFEGKAGWCQHVALERFSLDSLGGKDVRFKILDSLIKHRPACGNAISSILAAEKVAPLKAIKEIKKVVVEVYERAKVSDGTGEEVWNPRSREEADHSIPYVVAATLIDATVTLRSFDNTHLQNPTLRQLMQLIEVVENKEFTRAFAELPQQFRSRVTVVMTSGQRLVGESGGGQHDLLKQQSDEQIDDKFRQLSEEFLGRSRVDYILDHLWRLDKMENTAEILPMFVLG